MGLFLYPPKEDRREFLMYPRDLNVYARTAAVIDNIVSWISRVVTMSARERGVTICLQVFRKMIEKRLLYLLLKMLQEKVEI